MPVNTKEVAKIEAYNPTPEEKVFLSDWNGRVQRLKDYREKIQANPYDESKDARTVEKTWDFAEFVSLPHKYSHVELQAWQAKNSRPLIFSKIDTALSILFEKNPEVQLSARDEKWEGKTKLLTGLYNLSWDKGHGQQQLIKFIQNLATYGTAIAREFHRYEEQEVEEVVEYDPSEEKQKTEKRRIVKYDEAFFEVLPIRDVWLDDRARPYDEDSIRDWYWEVTYDYSTFLKKFDIYPNAKFVSPNYGESKDRKSKADKTAENNGPRVRLGFYENIEDNEFVISDGQVIVHKGPLIDNELSLVVGIWKMRNEFTIYGIGLPEILENDQELLDKVANMTVNQTILAIGAPGFYGGAGTVTEKEMKLEPKLKKLRDAEKIVFARIPPPDQTAFQMMEDIRNEADEMSGVTKSLGGEQVGKTLGEAVLNREAGLRRLALPLKNIQFALERHGRLRINNLQRIYSRPIRSEIIKDAMGNIRDTKLWQEYEEGKAKNPEDLDFINKFPEEETTGVVFRNQFKKERLPLERNGKGEIEFAEEDKLLEVTPAEIRGEFDIKVQAMSMIPMSKTLEEARALETYNILAQNPYLDLYKATERLLKKRGEKPEEWLQSKEEIIQTQEAAMSAPMMGMEEPQGNPMSGAPSPGGAPTVLGQPPDTSTAPGTGLNNIANTFNG